MDKISVKTKPAYIIDLEAGLLQRPAKPLKLRPQRACIISDPSIFEMYSQSLSARLKAWGIKDIGSILIPAGESSKNLGEVSKVYDALAAGRYERNDLLVALGGGVIGDISGFVAATYLRGLPYIQVPTTLVAQVDSSIGGKTGVDHVRGKNLIGAFYQPYAVWIDPQVLRTLPLNQRRSGLAEVVKYGIIADSGFFELLEDHAEDLIHGVIRDSDWPLWTKLIKRCCQIKAKIVKEDEKEITGKRAMLNYGHTFGHAFETLYHYENILHGEAVAVGMRAAARLSKNMGWLSAKDLDRIENLLDRLGLPSEVKKLDVDQVLATMASDKKVSGGKLRLVLPKKIGNVVLTDEVPAAVLREAIASVVSAKVLV